MATSTLGSGTLVLAGTTSGTTTVTATAVAGTTTLTLPAATDTLVGKATTDTLTNKTLTGAVMNGTLGATTPSTVAATTLTTSSTVTHNGGTANGVAYLNGSKVLTTGSALVFDGTNLGVGVTPSAWSPGKAVEVGFSGSGVYSYSQTDTELLSNAYYNAGYKYGGTGRAMMYGMGTAGTGIHAWYNAASGTAGNAITFTQAMTLDASNNLLLGTTSSATVNKGMKIIGGTSTSSSDYTFYSEFSNTTQSFGLRNDGNVVTTGNLLVGTTSPSPGYTNTNTGAQISASGSMFSRAATDYVIAVNQNTSDGGTYYQIVFRNANGAIGAITSTSTVCSYTSLSDYRLKNTIAPMTGALAKVALLKPCTYKWNADGSNGEGFIAHELAEVVPYAVTGKKDAVDSDGNPKYQGIDTSFLVATLTAAIQELNAKFEAYKATHP